MKNTAFAFLALIMILISCEKETQETIIDIPEFYTFSRDGASTVDFSGQTTRLLMANEFVSALSAFDKTSAELSDMLSNMNNAFENEALNASSKNIKSKVAASQDYFSTNTTGSAAIKKQFEDWIFLQVTEIGLYIDQLATSGAPGQIADDEKTRYISEKGLEYNQAIAKGLIGALMTDQILNHYLSGAVLDAGTNVSNNISETLEIGESYTSMEHYWDEAFGYIFGNSQDKSNPLATIGQDDKFLNEYVGKVNELAAFNDIAQNIFNAFKTGRAAIVADDFELRDEQSQIIKELLSKVLAVRAVFYLQNGKTALESNKGKAFHNLSEGFGFVYSLQFTRDPLSPSPYFTADEVKLMTDQMMIGNGFWDISEETIDEISNKIATAFGFEVQQAI